tara:strand:- start:1665 stop:2540 length:876 start_codon:yes stop_codon:yes gene_type:complete
MTVRLLLIITLLILNQSIFAWGYAAHRLTTRKAVNILNSPLGEYFYKNINFISENSIAPDLWRKNKEIFPEESHGHYIDADLYDKYPFRKIPRTWEKAVTKYGEENLKSWGTAPWRIQNFYKKLVLEFKNGNWKESLQTASALSHYIADIHVPFHTTENYNGQLSGNKGVHKRWEADMVEEYLLDSINPEGNLDLILDPVIMAFDIVEESFKELQKILTAETKARSTISFKSIDIIANWDQSMKGTEYIKILYQETGDLAIKRMNDSSLRIASYWNSAWIDAGKPLPPTIK